MIVKLILCVKHACKSTSEGIFEMFVPQYEVYMQEIVDQHIQINSYGTEKYEGIKLTFLCSSEELHFFIGVSI